MPPLLMNPEVAEQSSSGVTQLRGRDLRHGREDYLCAADDQADCVQTGQEPNGYARYGPSGTQRVLNLGHSPTAVIR
jgi:hypothetical protein